MKTSPYSCVPANNSILQETTSRDRYIWELPNLVNILSWLFPSMESSMCTGLRDPAIAVEYIATSTRIIIVILLSWILMGRCIRVIMCFLLHSCYLLWSLDLFSTLQNASWNTYWKLSYSIHHNPKEVNSMKCFWIHYNHQGWP